MEPRAAWKEGWHRFAFWERTPISLSCVSAIYPLSDWLRPGPGYWYARSTEILGLTYIQILRWLLVGAALVFGSALRGTLPDAVRVPSGD